MTPATTPSPTPSLSVEALLLFYDNGKVGGRVSSYVPGIGFVSTATQEKDTVIATTLQLGRYLKRNPSWKGTKVDDAFIKANEAGAKAHKVVILTITEAGEAAAPA